MNNIQVFNNPEFGDIRTVEIDGEVWFVGKDVAAALGYGNGKSLANAVSNHVLEEDKGVTEMVTPGGKQKMVVINDPAYTPLSLVASSHLLNVFSIGLHQKYFHQSGKQVLMFSRKLRYLMYHQS